MRLFNLLLLLTTSVSGFAQSFMNVKITLSDKVITVPKEDFVSLSFEEAKEQKEEFQDEIYIVGYDDYDPMCGIHSIIWSNNIPDYSYGRVPFITEWPAEETMTDILTTDGTNIYAAGMVQTNVVFDSGYRCEYAAVWRNWKVTSIIQQGYAYTDMCTPLSSVH